MTRLFLLIFLSISKVVADNATVQGEEGDITFRNYVPHKNFVLFGKPLKKAKVNLIFDCLHECTAFKECVSTNVNTTRDAQGLFECMLLDFDKHQNEANFSASKVIDHYAMPSKCDEEPCKHNGKCIPVYVTMETYYCKCLAGTKGKHCQIEDFSNCAQRYAAGQKDSGVYEIKAPDSTKLNVYCSQGNTTGWTMVFKAVSGAALSQGPSQLWTSSSFLETPSGLPFLNRTHYKNRLVEQWDTFKPSKVRLSLYKNTKEVVRVVFNGTGSNKINWFAVGRVLSSPWTDLFSAPKNFFSILGNRDAGTKIRSFFMNSVYPGCEGDIGWMVIVEKSFGCAWENSAVAFPIFYSPLSTCVVYHNTASKGVADMMIIYVQ